VGASINVPDRSPFASQRVVRSLEPRNTTAPTTVEPFAASDYRASLHARLRQPLRGHAIARGTVTPCRRLRRAIAQPPTPLRHFRGLRQPLVYQRFFSWRVVTPHRVRRAISKLSAPIKLRHSATDHALCSISASMVPRLEGLDDHLHPIVVMRRPSALKPPPADASPGTPPFGPAFKDSLIIPAALDGLTPFQSSVLDFVISGCGIDDKSSIVKKRPDARNEYHQYTALHQERPSVDAASGGDNPACSSMLAAKNSTNISSTTTNQNLARSNFTNPQPHQLL